MRAYLLIYTDVGGLKSALQEVRGIKGVVACEAVSGPYDMVAEIEASDLDQMAAEVLRRIQAVEGITRTLTCPVIRT